MTDIPTTCDIDWPIPLYQRRGATDRLCGILVLTDFEWRGRFPDERTQFRRGQSLARLARTHCPNGKEPALLLTETSAREGHLDHDRYHVTVVNIDLYLAAASSNPAAVYFAQLGGFDPITAAQLEALPALTQDQRDLLVMTGLNPDLLRTWLGADPARLAELAGVMREFDGGSMVAAMRGREQEGAAALVELLHGDSWNALVAAGAELPEALADSRILRARREHCTEFRQHLEAGDWAEPEWQGFFEQRTWIFGWGLEYQFLHTLQSRPYFGGRDITRTGGQEGDYLLATAASIRFTVIVEIKRPDAPLVGALYRNRTYPPGDDLAAGVAQMQQECRRWVVEGSMTEANRELLEGQGIYTNESRGILVIGNTADLGDDGAKIRSFESFRRHLTQPEVLTFDELLCRAEAIVALGEAAAAGREPQGQQSES